MLYQPLHQHLLPHGAAENGTGPPGLVNDVTLASSFEFRQKRVRGHLTGGLLI